MLHEIGRWIEIMLILCVRSNIIAIDSIEQIFELFGGISKHWVITLEIKIFQKVRILLQLNFSGIDAFSSDLNINGNYLKINDISELV